MRSGILGRDLYDSKHRSANRGEGGPGATGLRRILSFVCLLGLRVAERFLCRADYCSQSLVRD